MRPSPMSSATRRRCSSSRFERRGSKRVRSVTFPLERAAHGFDGEAPEPRAPIDVESWIVPRGLGSNVGKSHLVECAPRHLDDGFSILAPKDVTPPAFAIITLDPLEEHPA